MTHDVFKTLLMGYLDEELEEQDVARVEEHLAQCADCNAELEEFRRLKDVTHNMSVITPDARDWEEYWSNIYNRLERRIGWILVSVGAILLASYGLYEVIADLLFYSGISIVIRIGVLALVIGLCTLLISVLRERLFLARSDKYEKIKR